MPKGQRAALEAQHEALLQVVRDKILQDSLAKIEKKLRESWWPKTIWLGKDERVASVSVRPSGKSAVVITTIPAGDKEKTTIVPQYITKSGYTEEIHGREKVGDVQAGGSRRRPCRCPRGDAKWLKVTPADTVHMPAVTQMMAGTTRVRWR